MKINSFISNHIVRSLTLLFLLVCFPLTSSAAKLIYTFQIGSFSDIEDARKQFDATAKLLHENETDHLRIEKIGPFYSVRLGKFTDRDEAEKFLLPIKHRLKEHLLMEAYYKENRIKRLYKPEMTNMPLTERKPVTSRISATSISQDNKTEGHVTNKKVRALLAEESIYTFQMGSFNRIEDAGKLFEATAKVLREKETDHLRIEKIGRFYTVRLGKFTKRYEAEKFFQPIKDRIADSLLMEAYYREERIQKSYHLNTASLSQTEEKPLTRPASVVRSPQDAEKEENKVTEKVQATPAEEHVMTISRMVKENKYKEALEFIQPKLAEHPDAAEMHGWYGSILLKMGQPEEAIQYLRKAARLSPDVSDYHNGIGYCLFYLNNYHDAVSAFSNAVSINPSYVDALAGLGVSYSKLGQKEKAMDVYVKLRNIDGNSASKLLQIINRT
jgi:tetratricopeptide (TPR) repeat protein